MSKKVRMGFDPYSGLVITAVWPLPRSANNNTPKAMKTPVVIVYAIIKSAMLRKLLPRILYNLSK